jgi:hypothetical protein
MKVQTLLTQNPRLVGGKHLLILATTLTHVKTTDQAQEWWNQFCDWQQQFQSTLNERTHRGKSWWYTHRNLRRAAKHISKTPWHVAKTDCKHTTVDFLFTEPKA